MSIRKSLAITFAERYASTVISFVSTIIIARLLSPEEIGVFSVAVAFLTLAHMLRDLGVGNYLIKEKELTKEKVRTALGIAFVIAWPLAFLLFITSGYIAEFFDKQELQHVLQVLSVNFLLIPFSSPILPLLRREMRFDLLFKINVSSNFLYAATAICLAALDFSYMSLAWASLMATSTTFLLCQYYRPAIAKVWPGLSEWRDVLSFGSLVSLSMLIGTGGRNAVEMIIGKMINFQGVGLFSKAQGLTAMFQNLVVQAVSVVVHADFAKKYREGEDIRPLYSKGTSYITVIGWPFFGFTAIYAHQAIELLFGDQWLAAAPLMRVLSIATSIYLLHCLYERVFFALGKAKESVHLESIVQGTRITLVLVASTFSLLFVAYAQLVVAIATVIAISFFFKKIFDFSFVDHIRICQKSLYVTAIALAPIYLEYNLLTANFKNPFVILSLAGLTCLFAWIAAVFILRHEIHEELHLAISRFRPKKNI